MFILGVILLLCVVGLLCVEIARFEKKRVDELDGFLLFLRHVRGQVSSFSASLPDILQGFSCEALEKVGFLSHLEDGFSFALEETKDKLALKEEELVPLYQFAKGFGKSYKEDQLSLCDYTIAELEKLVSTVHADAPKRKKLAYTLVVSGSLALVLLLL